MTMNYEPRYVYWWEKDFAADTYVSRVMRPFDRHFYRALIIASYFNSLRPYLPNDDEQLWIMADAESLDQWLAHKPIVGKYWQQKRVVSDYRQAEAAQKDLSEARRIAGSLGGKAKSSKQKLASAKQKLASAKQNVPTVLDLTVLDSTVLDSTQPNTTQQDLTPQPVPESSASKSSETNKSNPKSKSAGLFVSSSKATPTPTAEPKRRSAVGAGSLGRSVNDTRTAGYAQHIQADSAVQAGTGKAAQGAPQSQPVGCEQPRVRKLNFVRATMYFPPDVDPADTDWA